MSIHHLDMKDLEKMIEIAVEKSVKKHLKVTQNQDKDEKWLSIKDACKQLRVSRQTLNNWQKDKRYELVVSLNFKKSGNRTWINADGIKRFMNENSILNSKVQFKYWDDASGGF